MNATTKQADPRTSAELHDAADAAHAAKNWTLTTDLRDQAYDAEQRERAAAPAQAAAADAAKKLRDDAIWGDTQAEIQKARAELAAQPIVTYPGDGFERGYDASEGE